MHKSDANKPETPTAPILKPARKLKQSKLDMNVGVTIEDVVADSSKTPVRVQQEQEPLTPSPVSLNPSLFNGKYFKLIECNDAGSGIAVVCQLCVPKSHTIKGHKNSIGNFIRHLKLKHNHAFV